MAEYRPPRVHVRGKSVPADWLSGQLKHVSESDANVIVLSLTEQRNLFRYFASGNIVRALAPALQQIVRGGWFTPHVMFLVEPERFTQLQTRKGSAALKRVRLSLYHRVRGMSDLFMTFVAVVRAASRVSRRLIVLGGVAPHWDHSVPETVWETDDGPRSSTRDCSRIWDVVMRGNKTWISPPLGEEEEKDDDVFDFDVDSEDEEENRHITPGPLVRFQFGRDYCDGDTVRAVHATKGFAIGEIGSGKRASAPTSKPERRRRPCKPCLCGAPAVCPKCSHTKMVYYYGGGGGGDSDGGTSTSPSIGLFPLTSASSDSSSSSRSSSSGEGDSPTSDDDGSASAYVRVTRRTLWLERGQLRLFYVPYTLSSYAVTVELRLHAAGVHSVPPGGLILSAPGWAFVRVGGDTYAVVLKRLPGHLNPLSDRDAAWFLADDATASETYATFELPPVPVERGGAVGYAPTALHFDVAERCELLVHVRGACPERGDLVAGFARVPKVMDVASVCTLGAELGVRQAVLWPDDVGADAAWSRLDSAPVERAELPVVRDPLQNKMEDGSPSRTRDGALVVHPRCDLQDYILT